MLTLNRFRRIEAALRRRGYGPAIEWSENIAAPDNAEDFAQRTIYVIFNSGFRNSIAEPIYQRCIVALRNGDSATTVFGHPGKALAIDTIWTTRLELFEHYGQATDPIEFLERLPWIGPITSQHLGKNLGLMLAKNDVHMQRLARRDQTTTAKLCESLARTSGYRVPTIDTILWRACADGLLNSQVYERDGWSAAINTEITSEAWQPLAVERLVVATHAIGDDPTA